MYRQSDTVLVVAARPGEYPIRYPIRWIQLEEVTFTDGSGKEMWDYRTRKYTFNYKTGTKRYKDVKEKFPESWKWAFETEILFDDHYLKPFGKHSEEILLCIRRYERDILDGKLGVTMDDWQDMFKTAVKHSKEVCPNIRYIEVCNESLCGGFIGCTVDEYYEFYKRAYRAVNEANKEMNLTGKNRLLVGGPDFVKEAMKNIGNFLKLYAADTCPDKKLEFISWHEYHNKYKAISGREKEINGMLKENGLPTGLPMFMTEHNPYHGKTGQKHFNLWNSACLVKSLYFTKKESPNVHILPWVLYHEANIQTRFMWYIGPNRPDTKAEEMKLQPVGCAMKFLAMHKDSEISVECNSIDGKDIVLASAAEDGMIVQAVNYDNPRDVELTINKISEACPALKGKKGRVKKYLIDENHSNCITNPDYPGDIQLIEERTLEISEDGSITLTEPKLKKHGTVLWELTAR